MIQGEVHKVDALEQMSSKMELPARNMPIDCDTGTSLGPRLPRRPGRQGRPLCVVQVLSDRRLPTAVNE